MKFFKTKSPEKFDDALTQGLMGDGAAHGFPSDLAPTSVTSSETVTADTSTDDQTGYKREGGPTKMERLFGFNAVRVTRPKRRGDEQNQEAAVPQGPRKPKQTSAPRRSILDRAKRRTAVKETQAPLTPAARP